MDPLALSNSVDERGLLLANREFLLVTVPTLDAEREMVRHLADEDNGGGAMA